MSITEFDSGLLKFTPLKLIKVRGTLNIVLVFSNAKFNEFDTHVSVYRGTIFDKITLKAFSCSHHRSPLQRWSPNWCRTFPSERRQFSSSNSCENCGNKWNPCAASSCSGVFRPISASSRPNRLKATDALQTSSWFEMRSLWTSQPSLLKPTTQRRH